MMVDQTKLVDSAGLVKTSLVFLRRDGGLLLAMKKRGFGMGRWNGPGGKLDGDETFEQAAVREVEEEIGVTAGKLTEVASLKFYMDGYDGDPMKNVHCVVYICDAWTGEPKESEEMAPWWFALDEIPYDGMWPDDKYWLPEVLAGKYVDAEFWFGTQDEVKKLKMILRSINES